MWRNIPNVLYTAIYWNIRVPWILLWYSWRNMDENIYERQRYVSPFSLYLSLCSVSLVSIFVHLDAATQPYLERQVLLPISQRDIESILDRRTEITERVEANVCRPFSGLVWGGCRQGRREKGIRGGKMGGIPPTYPNFHKVRDMKGSLGKYRCRSSVFPSRRRNGTVQDVN